MDYIRVSPNIGKIIVFFYEPLLFLDNNKKN